jgi:hypothetical protein
MGRPGVQRDDEENGDQEQLLSQTNRSGVRAIATPRVPDESGIDLSNAVTKVQPAIDLDAILREEQAGVTVSSTVSLDGPPAKSVPPLGPDDVTERVVLPVNPPVPSVETARFDTRVMSQLLADATAAHEASVAAAQETGPQEHADDRITTPPRRRSRVRKFVAALLVLLVMAGAFVLLVVAASRAEHQLPPHIVHAAQRLIALALH